jgi:hypothetical protein
LNFNWIAAAAAMRAFTNACTASPFATEAGTLAVSRAEFRRDDSQVDTPKSVPAEV